MDRHLPPHMPTEQRHLHHHAPSFPPPPPFHMQNGQAPAQIPFSDPFGQTRDPFLPAAAHQRRESIGRSWMGSNGTHGNGVATHLSPSQQNQLPRQQHPPPPPPHHPRPAGMPLPFDPSRRRSLGGNASPPQYGAGKLLQARHGAVADADRHGHLAILEPSAAPPVFQARNMPPPSPPQMHPHSSTSSVLGPAPRGPPTASPFAGIRDLASMSSHPRQNGGMSISSILGNGSDEPRKTGGSPHGSSVLPSPTPNNLMQPPSPGRARATSMREGYGRQSREISPGRLGAFGEPRSASAALGQERFAPEVRRENMFRSPQLPRESAHSFRAFRAPPDQSPNMNGSVDGLGAPGRPSSQPEISGPGPNRSLDEIMRRDDPTGGRLGVFRAFGDGPHKTRTEAPQRQDVPPFHHNPVTHPTSQPADRSVFGSPLSNKDGREQGLAMARFQPGTFGPPMREDQAGLFRPAFQPPPHAVLEQARESIESRSQYDSRRDLHRSSPPLSDLTPFPHRNGHHERPLTFEEHQRMEAVNRELEQRKGSDGAIPRAIMNLSPELSRRGRNSPLPQAVQGAQPRHVGPGGAGIKSEFGRMFSGLGSGVGSTTPTAGQSVNGNTTPSRLSPLAQVDGGDHGHSAMEGEDGKSSARTGRGGKKNGRRLREDTDKAEVEIYDGRMTPSLSQRGNKRSKTAHHHHHHAHHHHRHHHESAEAQPSPFNMLRFPSNPLPNSSLTPNASHHHHHHHAHPGHHHHHGNAAAPKAPAPRKPTLTVSSKALLDSVAHKPRKHLGSHLYETTIAEPSAQTLTDSRHSYTSTMRPLPRFTPSQENSTITVRVPRWHLVRSTPETPGRLEELCKRRQLFGSEVYTDDSDVVAAAVHSGWLKGDFGEFSQDLQDLCDNSSEDEDPATNTDKADIPISESPLELLHRPRKPVIPPPNYDAHITLLILPPLDSYASTNNHHILSRSWKGAPHDGMSYAIHSVAFVDEGPAGRSLARGSTARKARIAGEEMGRLEAARAMVEMLGGTARTGVSAGA